MATKKQIQASSKNDPATPRSPAYESAKRDYLSALEMLHKGDVANALERFRAIEAANSDEPEFAERMRTFAVICARKLADAPEPRDRSPRRAFGRLRSAARAILASISASRSSICKAFTIAIPVVTLAFPRLAAYEKANGRIARAFGATAGGP